LSFIAEQCGHRIGVLLSAFSIPKEVPVFNKIVVLFAVTLNNKEKNTLYVVFRLNT